MCARSIHVHTHTRTRSTRAHLIPRVDQPQQARGNALGGPRGDQRLRLPVAGDARAPRAVARHGLAQLRHARHGGVLRVCVRAPPASTSLILITTIAFIIIIWFLFKRPVCLGNLTRAALHLQARSAQMCRSALKQRTMLQAPHHLVMKLSQARARHYPHAVGPLCIGEAL